MINSQTFGGRPTFASFDPAKNRIRLRLIGILLICAAVAISSYGIIAWRNFALLQTNGIASEGYVFDVKSSRGPSTTISLRFFSESGEEITARCNVTDEFFYSHLAKTVLNETKVVVRYSSSSPSNFIVVGGTDPQVDACFCFAAFLGLLAFIALLPDPKQLQDMQTKDANNPMDRSDDGSD